MLLSFDLDGLPHSQVDMQILKEAFFFAVERLSARQVSAAHLSELIDGYKITWNDGREQTREFRRPSSISKALQS